MILLKKNVLVTGADGFIGSHLVEALLDEGCKVKAFVYYNSFNSWGWLDSLPKETLAKEERRYAFSTASTDFRKTWTSV